MEKRIEILVSKTKSETDVYYTLSGEGISKMFRMSNKPNNLNFQGYITANLIEMFQENAKNIPLGESLRKYKFVYSKDDSVDFEALYFDNSPEDNRINKTFFHKLRSINTNIPISAEEKLIFSSALKEMPYFDARGPVK